MIVILPLGLEVGKKASFCKPYSLFLLLSLESFPESRNSDGMNKNCGKCGMAWGILGQVSCKLTMQPKSSRNGINVPFWKYGGRTWRQSDGGGLGKARDEIGQVAAKPKSVSYWSTCHLGHEGFRQSRRGVPWVWWLRSPHYRCELLSATLTNWKETTFLLHWKVSFISSYVIKIF